MMTPEGKWKETKGWTEGQLETHTSQEEDGELLFTHLGGKPGPGRMPKPLKTVHPLTKRR